MVPLINILVIAGNDTRKRYQFICKPAKTSQRILATTIIITQIKIETFQELKKYFSQRKPDLIFAVGDGFVGFSGLIISKLCRTKYVLRLGGDPIADISKQIKYKMIQGDYIRVLKHVLIKFLNFITFKLCQNYFVTSEYLKQTLLTYLYFQHKNYYVLPQFRTSFEKKRKKYEVLSKKEIINILTVTNLSYYEKLQGVKLIMVYLDKYSKKYNQKIHYTVCGGGDYLGDLQKYNISNRSKGFETIIKGYQAEIDSFYQNCDIFLYCSEFDAFPNVILEAMSFGLPILVNKNDMFLGMIKEGENGCLFNKNDFNDFSDQLNCIVKNDSFRKSIMSKGFDHIKKHYSKAKIGRMLEKYIQKILDE